MPTLTRTIETDAPVQLVAPFLTDFTTTERWDPGTISCERLDAGDLKVGARFRNVSSFRGRETTLIYEITSLDPGRAVTLVGENKTVTSTDEMRFASNGGGTKVVYRVHFAFKGLARLAVPFLGGALRKLADDAAREMKRSLDALT
ncbi:SRPBCC family protein [Spirillospora sp. NPDC047279]|uniref:SRPBCC family protein n=1 Tax=Spirillospora sp. NPDC047279 TaxID=3155478 RepID=UPI0033E8E291